MQQLIFWERLLLDIVLKILVHFSDIMKPWQGMIYEKSLHSVSSSSYDNDYDMLYMICMLCKDSSLVLDICSPRAPRKSSVQSLLLQLSLFLFSFPFRLSRLLLGCFSSFLLLPEKINILSFLITISNEKRLIKPNFNMQWDELN